MRLVEAQQPEVADEAVESEYLFKGFGKVIWLDGSKTVLYNFVVKCEQGLSKQLIKH